MSEATPESAVTFRIEVLTSGLMISGSYDLPLYRRLSDALNGDQRRYLTLRDATLAPLSHPQQVQRVPELLVDRGEALLVTVLQEPPPPPNYYDRDELERAQLPRSPQPMLFFTSSFAVRAHFYQRPDMTLIETLERITDDFIPLSQVHIFPLASGQPSTRDFACISRARITALCNLHAVPLPAPSIPAPPESRSLPDTPPDALM